MKRPTALVIMDGLGYTINRDYNAVAQANTPHLDYLKQHYPHTILQAAGSAVGILEHQMGNSEVGHITIGAGRIINQPIKILHELITTNKLINLPVIKEKFGTLAQQQKTLHFIGLLSDAGVHAHIDHLLALIDIAKYYNIKHIAIHAFLDGRDSPPRSAHKFLEQLEDKIKNTPGAYLASICGRFYAMDRNHEWARTQQAYSMLTQQQEIKFADWRQALDYYYAQNITDEFIPPTQLFQHAVINNDDGIFFFNTRPDRARQLTQIFIDTQFDKFEAKKISLAFFITPVIYDKKYQTSILFELPEVTHTLTEILCKNNLSLFTIAETEKYAHVTYFFNSGRENKFTNETRVLIPSITTDSYKNFPEMRAQEITQAILKSLEQSSCDFYLINYANPDMVGHSGDFEATKKAVECVDTQIGILYKKIVKELDGTLYITADHGKAEQMFDQKSGQPNTAHTTNPVDFIFVNQKVYNQHINLPLHGLKDIAPFILKNFDIQAPKQMQ